MCSIKCVFVGKKKGILTL